MLIPGKLYKVVNLHSKNWKPNKQTGDSILSICPIEDDEVFMFIEHLYYGKKMFLDRNGKVVTIENSYGFLAVE